MRNTIIWWSAGGGAIVGLLAGLGLVALGAIALPALLQGAAARALERHGWLAATITLVVPALAGAVVGYLEGRLKLH